ncbi:hypothetical protein ARMGADRAFT_1034861 [Armillaria gallica]|uniref:Uncharacterized protein n=1 Tax=Armillaria gallica TaxID=47427 RepID=A0A2H3CW90_ARMGA|nr:hypothetical protein ARMGADRAFT_1034861 [Armillaria gallica]
MAASYSPPLHIAPLPSVDSSAVSLLDDYDSSQPQTRVSYGSRRRISIAVIIPGILIFIASAGLASALLIWLQSRRVESHIPREDHYFKNALVTIEGATAPHKLDDGSLESDTTMYGLAMSAVSAQLVALTVPFLLGLLGYRLASTWILAQEQERLGSMPTAAQYGLLVKLCGSANLFSAYETMRYLKHLWLHTTTSTFIHTSMNEIGAESMPDMGTKINPTMCQGPAALPPDYDGNYTFGICAPQNSSYPSSSDPSTDGRMLAEGLAVVGNSSSTSRSVMVDDMAVLVPSTMPDNVDNVTFSSFGLVAHCQPVVDCLVDSTLQSSFYCPSLYPPLNFSKDEFTETPTSDYNGIGMFNLTNNTASPYDQYPLDSVLNPYGVRVTLYWYSYEIVFPTGNSPGWYPLLSGSTYGYAFADRPVLSNFITTSILFAAFGPIYQANLVEYLKSALVTSLTLSTETFNTVLSRNMSYAAMGFASPLFERDVSTGGNAILLRSASRYPLAPLSAVLAILYTYAFLALAITVSSMMLSSREIAVTKSSGKEHRVTAIELVQLRLTNPLASIAERFSDPARPGLLLEPSAVDMFHEHPHAGKLGVVMADDEGEDRDGVVRRRRTFRIENVERRLMRLSGSTLNITSDSDFSVKET